MTHIWKFSAEIEEFKMKFQNVTLFMYFLTPFLVFFYVTVSAGFFENLSFKIRFATNVLEKNKKKWKPEKSRIILERWLRQW